MMKLDVHSDTESLFLNLKEQLKNFPVQLSRVTGKNNELVGLYITKQNNTSCPSCSQKIADIKNCAVTTEERYHLFKKVRSGS